MLVIKPFIRVSILSMILASLLIYLGVKYHWGKRLNNNNNTSEVIAVTANSADNKSSPQNLLPENINQQESKAYNPEIVIDNSSNSVLQSMTKSQITAECVSLMSSRNSDPVMLELATLNCVISNYQETYVDQSTTNSEIIINNTNRDLYKQQCQDSYSSTTSNVSTIQNALLIGICISDK